MRIEPIVENLIAVPSEKDFYIYRIMPVKRLIELFNEEKLTLISPLTWQDPFEHHWMERLYPEPSYRKERIKRLHGLCFSKESRSDALWRIYSPEKTGVRVKINLTTLINQLNKNTVSNRKVFIGRVDYLLDRELVDISNNLTQIKNYDPYDHAIPWLNKRRAFQHEAEIRLLCVSNDNVRNGSDIVKFKISPKELIRSINIDPRADHDLASELSATLKKVTGLDGRRIRQSGLYKLPKALRTP